MPTGKPFNDFYRYADWLLTVPLLLLELILVLGLSAARTWNLGIKLVVASVLMLGLGYVGEVNTEPGPRTLWGCLVLGALLLHPLRALGRAGPVPSGRPSSAPGCWSFSVLLGLSS